MTTDIPINRREANLKDAFADIKIRHPNKANFKKLIGLDTCSDCGRYIRNGECDWCEYGDFDWDID
jgi:hypothetical protein